MAQVKILSLYWKINSPFGTYLVGDNIITYWDTTADTYYTTLNGVAATSGTDIPPTFTYNGLSQSDYINETIYQASICDGTDLLTFQRYPLFPYLFKYQYPNHASCVVPGPQPTVCDLQFDALPLVTEVTTVGGLDGQIIVSASGSNGAVQYRLNSDFVYNDGTSQTSGTFTGLGVGNYLVYARDAINCLSVMSVTVPLEKTYGVIYRLDYDYRNENNVIEHSHRTEILQLDYSGAVDETIKGGAVPTLFSLRAEGEKDKFVPLLPTEMIFTLISETEGQFQGLYTNDQDRYRMRHSIDSGSGYSVVWIGKVVPNQYQEQYGPTPYEVQSIATDGLALLRDEYFVDDDNNRLSGELKQISVIAWILKKIGLGINIRSGCNIYATGMASTAASDPLDEAYVDVSRYYLINEVPTCWDVLTWILEPYGAQLVQYFNVWNIIRAEERITDWDYREYDADGAYVSNSNYNPIKDIKSSFYTSRLCWMDRNQLLIMNHGYGSLRLLYNLGLKPNIFPSGDFSVKKYSVYQATGIGIGLIEGTIPDLTGFQFINNGTQVTKGIEQDANGGIAIGFNNTQVGGYLQSDPILLKMNNSEDIKLSIRFRVDHPIGFHKNSYLYVKVKILVKYGDYYLGSDGSWSLTEVFIIYYVDPGSYDQYITYEVVAESPDSSYISGENIEVRVYLPHPFDYDYTTQVQIEQIQTTDLDEGYRIEWWYDLGGSDYLYYYQLLNTTDAESVPDIIEPDDYNLTTNPYKWVLQKRLILLSSNNNSFFIDFIKINILNVGRAMPEFALYDKSMENKNQLRLDKIIMHGSLLTEIPTFYGDQLGKLPSDYGQFTNKVFINNLIAGLTYNSAGFSIIYSGYLRNSSGTGYTTWVRDAVAESATLESIFQEMYSAQYNKPWRSLSGSMTGDILFTPLDTIRETMDSNRLYYPVAYEVDFYRNQYRGCQFLEMTDVTAATGDVSAAFTTGFSLGFES